MHGNQQESIMTVINTDLFSVNNSNNNSPTLLDKK